MPTPLSFYPRPPIDTGIGMHDSHLTGDSPPDVRQHAKNLRKAGVSWYKMLCGGVNKVERARIYNQEGIKPIIRLYKERPHPHWLPNRDEVAQYVAVGAEYIEAGNEQNLLDETEGGINPEAVAAQWIRASDIIKSGGGIPVVYACTPGGHMNHRTYTNRFLAEVKRLGRLDSFEKAVLGIHPRPLNNPPDQPRDTGNPPNTTTWNEWTWYREAYFNYLGWHIPMIATEHGYSGGGQENGEHPPMNATTWAEWNKELFLRFNPAHPKAVAPEFLAACYWLEVNHGVWIHDGLFARDGREWIGDVARPDDRSWGKALWTIQPTWNRRTNTGTPPTNLPTNPIPPTTPPSTLLREVINQPAWVSFVEPTVAMGAEYFELTRFRFVDEAEAQGKVNIFILDPHNPNLRIRVTNTGTGTIAEIPLDKPAGEPAANVPMFGIGNVYDVEMLGLPSVKVKGMQLPGNRHVFYELTFAKRVKQGVPPPPPNTLETALWTACEAAQIPVNRTFALPKALIATSQSLGDNGLGIDVVSGEVSVTHEGLRYKAQLAQRWSDNLKVLAYCRDGDWSNVRVIRK